MTLFTIAFSQRQWPGGGTRKKISARFAREFSKNQIFSHASNSALPFKNPVSAPGGGGSLKFSIGVNIF